MRPRARLGFGCWDSFGTWWLRFGASPVSGGSRLARPLVLIGLMVLGLSSATAAVEGGGYAGAFLRLGVGARAAALGGAFSAVTDGAASTHWNPAACPWVDGRAVTLSHWFLGLDRTLSHAGYAQPLPYGGGLGLAWVGARTSDIDGRDSDGRPTEMYADQRHAFYFNLGIRPHRLLSVGITLKSYHRRAAEQAASGAGFDLGVLVRPVEGVSVALVGHELGITRPSGRSTGTYWSWNTRDYWGGGFGGYPREISRSDRFLKRLRIGTWWEVGRHLPHLSPKLPKIPVQAFLDVEKVEAFEADVLVGIELGAEDGFVVRVGHGAQGLVAGVGVTDELPVAVLRVDYAVVHMDLSDGYTHQVQVSFWR